MLAKRLELRTSLVSAGVWPFDMVGGSSLCKEAPPIWCRTSTSRLPRPVGLGLGIEAASALTFPSIAPDSPVNHRYVDGLTLSGILTHSHMVADILESNKA